MTEKKIEINLDELRKRHLFIATPAYGGGMHCSYVTSLLKLQKMLNDYGIPHTIQFMYNESLISRARNKLVDLFLQTSATDLMFIDADIEFTPEDVLVLMHMNQDVIGGAYPLKTINWENIKRAVLKDPDIPADSLATQGAEWASHPFTGEIKFDMFEPLEIRELATGFMMIKRSVFEALEHMVPGCPPPAKDKDSRPIVADFFQVGVHGDRYESEDYSFCRLWSEAGGKIYLCPWMKLNHHGSFAFRGDMFTLAAHLGEVH